MGGDGGSRGRRRKGTSVSVNLPVYLGPGTDALGGDVVCVRVCVRACVRAGVRACVRACVRVCVRVCVQVCVVCTLCTLRTLRTLC